MKRHLRGFLAPPDVPAPALVLLGLLGLQGGAALSVGLFPLVGPAGVVLLRLVVAAGVLLVVWRPRPARVSWRLSLLAGTAMAVHHLCFYEAVDRLPLGAATTVEFLGPFVLSLLGSRRPADLAWSLLAVAGVTLLGRGEVSLDPVSAYYLI